VLAIAILAIIWGAQARAASSATVTATVTVQNISITITAGGTQNYGTLAQNSTATSTEIVISNNGNVNENILIRGQNSANWTLGATAGTDQYVHRFCTAGIAACQSPPTNYTALTTSNQTHSTFLAPNAATSTALQINTPNPSTVFTQQSVDVIITATAS
jgi:hypothetical protein